MRNMRIATAIVLLSTAIVCVAGEESGMDKPSFSASQSLTISALVEAIDHETRVVTVLKPDGEKVTFTADDQVRNLAQVNVGDYLIVFNALAKTYNTLARPNSPARCWV